MLTKKQYDLLAFINARMKRDGVPPSFDEMKEALDLRSKSGIHRLITALEERGFIRRLAHRARAIEIVKLPEALGEAARPRSFEPSVLEGGRSAPEEKAAAAAAAEIGSAPQVRSVPLVGRIAAGTPISALEHVQGHVGVPSVMLGSGGDHFALEVKGDSMIEAGIHSGDLVVIKRQDSADNGDIVVALVEEEEATLKRLRRNGGSVALEPANRAYETRVYSADKVRVQGRMVGLIRTY